MQMRLSRGGAAATLATLATLSILMTGCAQTAGGGTESGGDNSELPEEFADDPVAQAVGPEIFNAALEEGALTIYSGELRNFMEAYGNEAFQDFYGIDVEALDTSSSEGADRIRAESASGNVTADVYSAVSPYFYEFMTFDGLLEYEPAGPLVNQYPENNYPQGDAAGHFWPFTISPKGVEINTDLVEEADYPTSYNDLLDPKWEGKLVVRDPTSPGGGAWSMLQMWEHPDFGPEWVKALAATDPFIIPDQTCQSVVSGQFAISFPGTGECNRDNPDGPVAYAQLEEGQTWLTNNIGIINNSPHPNAAKLFLTWIYHLENLQEFTNISRVAPVPGITTEFPTMDLENYPLMENQVPEEVVADPTAIIEEFVEIFGEQQ